MSILNNAIENGDLETVKNLIEVQGYSANYAGFFGLINIYSSPLKVAAQHNQPEILEYLIEKGADINGNEAMYNAPIMIAHRKEHIKIVATLLKHDPILPDWLNKDDLIKSYMHKAIEADDVFSVETLLTCSKAHIDSTEFNFLSFIKLTLLDKACTSGSTEVVAKLIELGASTNLVDNLHITALHRAVFNGSPEIVELLLDNGVIVDLTGPENRTALMAASTFKDEKHEKVLELLIKYGAEVNKTDIHGFSALEYAAASGTPNALKTLLNAGADLHHKTHDNKTAADLALEYGHTEIAKILISPSAETSIDIHEVLVTDNGSFTSDVIIDNDNHGLFSTHYSKLVLEQVNTYAPETHIAVNQSFEAQQIPSFG